MPNKMKKFKKYLDDLWTLINPKYIMEHLVSIICFFKCAEIDLFEICNDFNCGLKSYFTRDTNNKYRNMVTNLIEAKTFYIH